MEARLAAIAAEGGDQKEKTQKYQTVLTESLSNGGDVEGLKQMVVHMLSDVVPLVTSRQILSTLCSEAKSLPAAQHKDVAEFALEKITPRVVSFEEQVSVLREGLAKLLKDDGKASEAASMLAGIDLDSGIRNLSDEYKLRMCVDIAMLYLEDDDATNADAFIKKASFLLGACKEGEALELQYKSCYARILDAKMKFTEASLRYYELSQTELGRDLGDGKVVTESDLAASLTSAIIACILAAAGPQRARVLATLYKDDRCAKLPIYPVFEKVYLERILRADEAASFASTLRSHHLTVGEDGLTVVTRAISEHNLLSASKLYNNIKIDELGTLLGLPPDRAERTAARMIGEERMAGSIDQVDGFIDFQDPSDGDVINEKWDAQITSVCTQVNDIVDMMENKGIPIRL